MAKITKVDTITLVEVYVDGPGVYNVYKREDDGRVFRDDTGQPVVNGKRYVPGNITVALNDWDASVDLTLDQAKLLTKTLKKQIKKLETEQTEVLSRPGDETERGNF